MSNLGHLVNLVNRHNGIGETVRPRMRSRFEDNGPAVSAASDRFTPAAESPETAPVSGSMSDTRTPSVQPVQPPSPTSDRAYGTGPDLTSPTNHIQETLQSHQKMTAPHPHTNRIQFSENSADQTNLNQNLTPPVSPVLFQPRPSQTPAPEPQPVPGPDTAQASQPENRTNPGPIRETVEIRPQENPSPIIHKNETVRRETVRIVREPHVHTTHTTHTNLIQPVQSATPRSTPQSTPSPSHSHSFSSPDSALLRPETGNLETVTPDSPSSENESPFRSRPESPPLLTLPLSPANVSSPFNGGNNRQSGQNNRSSNASEETGTVVNVTIGRIEVKAAAPQSARPEPRPKEKPSGIMTLETYLKMRSNGGRQ